MAVVQIVNGFSLLNRWLIYTSFMLSPAQFMSGLGNNCPSNIGFLAYNWYTQINWYQSAKAKEMHAVSLVLVHVNLLFSVSYLGGVSSGSIWMGLFLGAGTAGVIIMNTISAWTAWATNMVDGYGEYRFFFFGWRTLSTGWHTFILCWQIADSLLAFVAVMGAFAIPVMLWAKRDKEQLPWWARYPAIPVGAAMMMFVGWPMVLWIELLVQKNHIQSDTDWIAVWLFVAQVVTMLAPSCTATLSCFGFRKKGDGAAGNGVVTELSSSQKGVTGGSVV